ncbi:MAG: helix-turn-helix transcriptional regulator [Deltaproteobacteria bacterium]|nr:helix-turn-helix transcriptional regulator [Deltaproteobacteria bacterium]
MVSKLSKREYEIAELVAWGLTKKEVANRLNISFHTVSQHVRHMYEKLQIRKETDLTRWYFIQRSWRSFCFLSPWDP